MMKKIYTHTNPDTDAIGAVWIIKRFLPGWEKAEIGFAESNKETKARAAKDDSDILFVDVGRGKLDHHQSSKISSATKLCWDYVQKIRGEKNFNQIEKKAIETLVGIETEIDNARFLLWLEVVEDREVFYFYEIIAGLRGLAESDAEVMEFGLRAFDAMLLLTKSRLKADEELATGQEFETVWGKAIAVLAGNREVISRGQMKGYCLVVLKDPEIGGVRIYSRPGTGVDLTAAYEKLKKMDPAADWFLHSSKQLLLNQSSTNLHMKPTKLSLTEVIGVLKTPKKE